MIFVLVIAAWLIVVLLALLFFRGVRGFPGFRGMALAAALVLLAATAAAALFLADIGREPETAELSPMYLQHRGGWRGSSGYWELTDQSGRHYLLLWGIEAPQGGEPLAVTYLPTTRFVLEIRQSRNPGAWSGARERVLYDHAQTLGAAALITAVFIVALLLWLGIREIRRQHGYDA